MIEAYKSLWQNAFNFSGRARRREYWLANLFNLILIIGFIFLSGLISQFFYGLYTLYCLLLFIPSLSLTVRRFHDTGKSGFNIFWGWVPLIGFIIVLLFLCTEGDSSSNKYGPNPKGVIFDSELNSL